MSQRRSEQGIGRSLLRRAGASHGSSGAGALFARLDALDQLEQTSEERRVLAADVLARWAERVRAGMWSVDVATLVAQAEALERALGSDDVSED